MTVEVRRDGARIEVSVAGATPTGGRQPWSVLLRGIEDVGPVTGGTAERDALGTRVGPDVGARAVTVRVEESV